jgi:hypothetical protein
MSVTAVAQEPITPVDPGLDTPADTSTTTTRANDNRDNFADDDTGFNPGWLGLLGLIGLAGLMPRDRRDRHVHTHNAGATTTTRNL